MAAPWKEVFEHLRKVHKDLLTAECKSTNADAKAEYEDSVRKILKFDLVGPFGSCDSEVPVDVDEVYQELNSKNSYLRDSWTTKRISEFDSDMRSW